MAVGRGAAERGRGAPPARGRRSRASARAAAYPYDAGADRLSAALDGVPGGFLADPKRIVRLAASLPARGGRPVASDRLVAEPPSAGRRPAILPWSVHAVRLDPEEALTLLASIPHRGMLRRPPIPGRSSRPA